MMTCGMQQRDSKERGTAGPTTSVHYDRQHMLDGTETYFLGEAFDNVGESSRHGMNCHGRKDNSGQHDALKGLNSRLCALELTHFLSCWVLM